MAAKIGSVLVGLVAVSMVMQSLLGLAGTQELRGVRVGLGDSWMRLVKESHAGPRGASERSGGLPERRGVSGQLGFAVESHRGTTIE
jgi:hypothetical protein